MFFLEIPVELLGFCGPIRFGEHEEWYRLVGVVPGEQVPPWLHAGGMYRGHLGAARDAVTLYAPDSELAAIVSASLVQRVQPPEA
jgi:hypothetical protein